MIANTTRDQYEALIPKILWLRSQRMGLKDIANRLGCGYKYVRQVVRTYLPPTKKASELDPPDHQYRIVIEQLRIERELKEHNVQTAKGLQKTGGRYV